MKAESKRRRYYYLPYCEELASKWIQIVERRARIRVFELCMKKKEKRGKGGKEERERRAGYLYLRNWLVAH
jgi:hypothetical protein